MFPHSVNLNDFSILINIDIHPTAKMTKLTSSFDNVHDFDLFGELLNILTTFSNLNVQSYNFFLYHATVMMK